MTYGREGDFCWSFILHTFFRQTSIVSEGSFTPVLPGGRVSLSFVSFHSYRKPRWRGKLQWRFRLSPFTLRLFHSLLGDREYPTSSLFDINPVLFVCLETIHGTQIKKSSPTRSSSLWECFCSGVNLVELITIIIPLDAEKLDWRSSFCLTKTLLLL